MCGEKLNLTEYDNHISKKNLLVKYILPSDELTCICGEPVIILVGQVYAEDKPFRLFIPHRWYTEDRSNYEDMPHTEPSMLLHILSNTIIDQMGYVISYNYFKSLIDYYSQFKKSNLIKNIGIKTDLLSY